MKKNKQEIVTFKVSQELLDELKKIPNRSEFIRRAISGALQNICPLCQGAGFLSPSQKEHWESFITDHSVEECPSCHEIHLVCDKSE